MMDEEVKNEEDVYIDDAEVVPVEPHFRIKDEQNKTSKTNT
jgi:hypothetical protein